MSYTIKRISDNRDILEDASKWFSSKWRIPLAAYRESMEKQEIKR